MKYIAAFFCFFSLAGSSYSQSLVRTDSVKVEVNSAQLKNPWAGGINYAQVSEIDLNSDGTKDLYLFDRTGNKSGTFINLGTPGVVSYKHDASYESRFPLMHDWALLRDYNCDGKEDIFTYNTGSVTVYKNTSTATQLSFTLVKQQIISNYNPNYLALYVSAVDIPSISDIDNDGDMDILTFSVFGQTVEYHQNMSMETYGNCDSLVYNLSDKCWGSFTENPAGCSANLNQNCVHMKMGETKSVRDNQRDAGFALLAMDTDGDADKELLVSTINCTTMYLLTNTGTTTTAFMGNLDLNYPPSNPVNLTRFPAAYLADVNNDGKKDLIVSPNAANISENFTSMWFYRNNGTATFPDFSFAQTNLLQDEMLDFGDSSIPTLIDYDGDGLKDLFVGNYGYYQNGQFKSQVAHFKNAGTTTSPLFRLITRDFATLSTKNISNMHPSFADLDADGDLDLMIGDATGTLQYFEYTGSGFSMVPNFQNSSGTMIDVGNYAAPQLFDLDKDGKLDLIIGERSGNINFYRNIGTVNAPSFALATDSLGKVNVTQKGFTQGYSKPFFFRENGTTKLFVGSDRGYIFAFDNIDNNVMGKFNRIDSIYQGISEGSRSSITGADLNADGTLEAIIGNSRGGLAFYSGIGYLNVQSSTSKKISVFPNPATESFRIDGLTSFPAQVSIFDLAGKLQMRSFILTESAETSVSGLAAGTYLVSCVSGTHAYSAKLVVE